MNAVTYMPNLADACDRINARTRAENIAAERAEALVISRKVLRSPDHFEDHIIRDACSVLETYGDGMDYMLADQAIHALNLRERQRAHKAALTAAADETRVQIAMRYRRELVAVGKGLVLAVLAAVAFNVWVLA